MVRRENLALAAAGVVLAIFLVGPRPAAAQIMLADHNGWRLSTDGRVNTFVSWASGTGLPGEPDFLGAGTNDTANAKGDLQSTRIRNGFLMSILGFTGQKVVNPNFKVTTRVALWMNVAGSRTKNVSALVDPRELYGKIEGGWGSLLAGSELALFGRGGILVDAQIAHDYGLGYPCGIRDASGGACGMAGFGAVFPGYEPGLVYATPTAAGVQLSLGVYDPATIGNAQLNRAPLPRLEGELTFDFHDSVRLFASGFWQVLEGTVQDSNAPAGMPRQKNLHVNAWGAQAGGMVTLGPVMLGGAAFQGAGFSPITYIDEHQIAADSTGTLRDARGAFGLGAISIDSLNLKIAGGVGVWHVDKSKNDAGTMSATGTPTDPQVIKQNFGATVGLYQTTAPVHFALEYFRAQHTWYDRGVANAANPAQIDVSTPEQVVTFINAGMTVTW
jgi:hypothetical protein